MNIPERCIYSISQINSLTRACLEENFSSIWIEGEISNLVTPSSGHSYFSLKDNQAQLRCALFSMQARRLNFKPNNGMQVLAFGKISLYENRGDYQFIVESLEERGDGELQRAFELLKQKLAAEGLFQAIHKKALPLLPKQIAVITSPTGAAIRDILKLLKHRFPAIPVLIYPSLVQGDLAPGNIVKMIQLANQRQECDVLILARGGGSLEDLWAFNTENVARAIFASTIPIISAVGHEIDFTIADFIADYRAPTPSAAAMCVTPDKKAWLTQLHQLQQTLLRAIYLFLEQKKQQLQLLASRLPHPQHRLREQIQTLDGLERRLIQAMNHFLFKLKQNFQISCRTLDAVSPLATLSRGYAVALTEEGHVITDSAQVQPKQSIEIKLYKGSLRCVVER
ncbi:MAG: exodeoxyribonuclease VII large subunit [Gammaproteobacteria bacterium]|nr:exodeoxyribonuclease VII large subunit [Gammaproteobacteria bacterium]